MIIILCIISLFCLPILAQLPPNIELEADRIEYTKNKKSINAYDNVELSYKGYRIFSNEFIFDTEKSIVQFPGSLTLDTQSQTIYTENLSYNFKTLKGQSYNLSSQIGSLQVSGEQVHFNPTTIVVKNCLFTTCGKKDPDYSLESKELIAYYHLGLFIAKKNTFKFKYMPFNIYIPYYIYGSKHHSLLEKYSILPKFGTNQLEGNYVKYTFNYILSTALSGTADIGFSKKLGLIYGGSTIFQQTNSIYHGLSYHIYPKENLFSFYSISQWTKNLGNTIEETPAFLDSFIENFDSSYNKPVLESTIIFQKNKIINDVWVNHLPKTTFSFRHFSWQRLTYNSHLSASFSEESNLVDLHHQGKHIEWNNEISKKIALHSSTDLVFNLSTYSNRYSNKQLWDRVFQGTTISFKSLFLSPEISFLRTIYSEGTSPFLYQRNYAINSDEIGLKINHTFNVFQVSYIGFYTIETETFRQQDIGINLLFHCWGFGLLWKTEQDSFNFTFNLF